MSKVQVRVPIEVDVTYTNKTWFSMRNKQKPKQYVIGFFQRHPQKDGRVTSIIEVLVDNNPETIAQSVFKNISKGCLLYCEENILPPSLKDHYEIHELKASDGHAKGDLHINNVKNMWRDLKRSIKTDHVSVSTKYLQSYCDLITWRINNRHLSERDRFHLALSLSVKPGSHRTQKDIVK